MASTFLSDKTNNIKDSWVYFGLLTLLVWAPIPLGSTRSWAIGILLLVTALLLFGTVLAWRQNYALALQRLTLFTWPLCLLASMVSLAWLQTATVPAAWVALVSPNAAALQAPSTWMTLSLDVYQSHYMATLSCIYFLIFAVTVLTVRNAQRLEKLALVLVINGVCQSIVASVLYSFKASYRIFFVDINHSFAIGTFVNHNHLAGYLCMVLSIGIGLMLARLNSKPVNHPNLRARLVATISFILSAKMRLRLLLVVMVIGLVLTRSRMGNSAFFSAMLIIGGIAIVLARKTAPKTIALITSLIIVDVFLIGTFVGLEKVVDRVQGTEITMADGGKSESIEERTIAARTALAMVQDYPLVGTGGGSFYNVFLSYRTAEYGYSFVDHTHNDYVEIATDFGLIGLSILGLLVALTLITVLKVMAKRKSPLPWGMAFGVAMSIVALLIHSTVDFNLQIPANALTIVVIIAMGWLSHTLPSGTTTPKKNHYRD